MLEEFGFVVDFIPAVAEVLHEVGLDEPVAADHGQCQPDPGAVRVMALYGLWSTRPWSLSLRTISETEELATPRRCASCEDVMGLSCHSVKP